MKTPRDILLARHQTAMPKLDAIRREVVANLNHQDTKAPSRTIDLVSWCLGGLIQLWRQLFWPCRRIWSGLATMWIFLAAVNLAQRDNVSSVTGKPVRSAEVIMSAQNQQRWLNELLADRSAPAETDRPRNLAPKPRTEKSKTAAV
jgi:hypothetical protein